MFEKTRSDLVKRLKVLLDRFDTICDRATTVRAEGVLAVRLGLGDNGQALLLLNEVIAKAGEQAGLCGQSITHLLVDRAFPPMFKTGVSKAEKFAEQCETILSQFDMGKQLGKQAFQDRFGVRT